MLSDIDDFSRIGSELDSELTSRPESGSDQDRILTQIDMILGYCIEAKIALSLSCFFAVAFVKFVSIYSLRVFCSL